MSITFAHNLRDLVDYQGLLKLLFSYFYLLLRAIEKNSGQWWKILSALYDPFSSICFIVCVYTDILENP